MNKKAMTIILSAAMTVSAAAAFSCFAEENTMITIPASEAILDGVTLKDTDFETPIAYDEEHDCIMGIGEFSTISYTIPEGVEGNYDIYLEVSKGGNAFVSGSTPITITVNDGITEVPCVNIAPCSMAQMGITGDPVSFMDDMGTFAVKTDIALTAGDVITIGGVPGYEFKMDDSYSTSMPAIGDLMIAETGSEVMVGYEDNKKVNTAEEADESDILSGLEIAWLGSSVTYGQGAAGYSMADTIAEKHPATNCYKYAISGTTLAEYPTSYAMPTDGDGFHGSYIYRMKQLNPDQHYDLFICQLSTNDATNGVPMGAISESEDIADFDTATVVGAMEYIIAYARQTWDCPVMFYTGTKYDSEQYQEMVDITLALQEKWNIGVVDLWNNEEMNAVSEEDYAVYMKDEIHPFREGYEQWWAPAFEEAIAAYIAK